MTPAIMPFDQRTTRVHLVRHGHVHNPWRMVYGRLPGWTLSSKGREQAEAVARALAGRPISALYSSPLERAQETAAILSRVVGVPVRVRDELIESALAAQWEGMSWPHVWVRRRREWETYRKRPLELRCPEPLADLALRMAAAVRDIVAAHPGQEVVAVSHGDPIKAAVIVLTGADLARLHDQRLPTGGRIALEVDPDGRARVLERDA